MASVTGTNNSETLIGTATEDTIEGLQGDDILMGGDGDDQYIFNIGDGQDIINDSDGYDYIYFGAGIATADIDFSMSGDDLIISYSQNPTDTITITDYNAGGTNQIEYIEFEDEGNQIYLENLNLIIGDGTDNILTGTTNRDLISTGAGNDTLNGDLRSDYLYSGDGNDILNGGRGDDIMIGGDGDDRYLYELGDGNDKITDSSGANDTLEFGTGITEADIGLSMSDGDLIVRNNSNGGRVVISDQNGSGKIEKIKFNDGNEISFVGYNLVTVSGQPEFEGTSGADLYYGRGDDNILIATEGDDILNGAGGNDRAYYGNATNGVTVDLTAGTASGLGNDTLISIEEVGGSDFDDTITGNSEVNYIRANEGNDTVYGLDGDDELYGREGNDQLYGGDGDDLIYGGEGHDFIDGGAGDDEIDDTRGNNEIIGGAGDDVISTAGGNDIIDGGADNDEIYANGGNDIITGGTGDDEINGGNGDDEYIFNIGDGQDTIYDSGGENDFIRFGPGITANDILISEDGSDLIIDFPPEFSDQIIISDAVSDPDSQIEKIVFDDGSELPLAGVNIITGTNGSNIIEGTADVDVILGRGGDDILVGSESNDTLNGGDGADRVFYGDATNGVIVDLTAGAATGQGNDTLISIEEVGGSDFDDTITGNAEANTIRANEGNDTVYGLDGNDILDGREGHDVLLGGNGDDNISGFDGHDLIRGGANLDIINAGQGNDTIVVVGVTSADQYTASSITNSGGSGTDLSTLINLADLNGQAVSEAVAGEEISGDQGNDSLHVYGTVDLSDVTISGIENLIVNSELTLSAEQLTTFTTIDGDGGSIINIDALSGSNDAYVFDVSLIDISDISEIVIDGNMILKIENVDDLSGIDSIIGSETSSITLEVVSTGVEKIIDLGDLADKFNTIDTIDLGENVTLDINNADDLTGLDLDEILGTGSVTTSGSSDVVDALDNLNIGDGVSTQPVAMDDLFIGEIGKTLSGNLLVNDNDVDGDPLSTVATSLVTTNGGFVNIYASGDFDYTPAHGFYGSDSFEYNITDPDGNSDNATVSIDVELPANTISGEKKIKGTSDDDVILMASSNKNVHGKDGNDIILGSDTKDHIRGNDGNDVLVGNGGNDHLKGGDGNDTILGGDGKDHLDGNDGDDHIDGGAGKDKLRGQDGDDYLNGGDGNDSIKGDKGNDTLIGGDGNDILMGGKGDDILNGGLGTNKLDGGKGADTFVFDVIDDTPDLIKKFSGNEGDSIDLSELLQNYDPIIDDLLDFVQISETNGPKSSYILSVDIDGGGDNFTEIAILEKSSNITDEFTAVDDGLLIL